MIILKATTESLQIVTTSTAAIDYSASFVDITTTTFNPSTNEGKITTATTTANVVSAPAASTQRQVKLLTVVNRDASVTQTVIVQKLISSTTYNLTPIVTLLAGETFQYMDGQGWIYYSANGTQKGSQAAAGSTYQIQFNNGTNLTGDPDLTWNSSTNTLALANSPQILLSGVSLTPTPPVSGNLSVYAQAIAGKLELMKVGPSGDAEALQAALWQNNTVIWTPGATTGTFQGTVGATVGTAGSAFPTTTNLYTAMRRSTFASTATAQTQAGIRTDQSFFRGAAAGMGGFLFVCRFGITTWTAGDRLFVGLSVGSTGTAGNMVTANPSTFANSIGFCIDGGDTAITFLHMDGSTATKDVITGQPALAANNGYDAYIYARPNDTTVYYRLDNSLTGTTLIDTSTTTTLPVNTTLLYGWAMMGNAANTTIGAATIGINRLYIETNR